jgi:ABC-2 type transport system ATP-binding protein
MSTILSVHSVSKNYAAHQALNNVSVEVPTGAVFGLLGPNGAGKTSLIRIINQITGPDGGTILFNNEPLNPSHTHLIGYLPEERGLYKKMEVGEQAVYLARLKGLSRPEAIKRLKFWFEKFEIKGWWRKKVDELSKGMQQKVQFIVTIIHEPPLLILDEPFSGFDPINANLIKDELLNLKDKGATIILSTHRMESVEELCTDIALLNRSKKIVGGSIADIRKSYKSNTYEIAFSGSSDFLNDATNGPYTLLSTSSKHGLTTLVVKLNPNSKPNDLISTFIPRVQIERFQEIVPSMNDIFIQSVNASQE